jgi:hypothetical protein
MSNFALINAMTVGASSKVCQMGDSRDKYEYDDRPYGKALAQEGYPKLRRWIEGDTADDALGEALAFLADAISRGSIPMLTVAGLALVHHPELCLESVARLPQSQQDRFRSLVKMGAVLGDCNQLFKDWHETLGNAKPCAA